MLRLLTLLTPPSNLTNLYLTGERLLSQLIEVKVRHQGDGGLLTGHLTPICCVRRRGEG